MVRTCFLFTTIFETIFGIISFRTTVKPEYKDKPWDLQKGFVVQKLVIRQRLVKNFVVVLAGLGIQAGRCFQVVIVWVRVVVNRGLIVI